MPLALLVNVFLAVGIESPLISVPVLVLVWVVIAIGWWLTWRYLLIVKVDK